MAAPVKLISLDNLDSYNDLISQTYEPKTVVISYQNYLNLPAADKSSGTIFYVPDAPNSVSVLGDYIFSLSGTLTAGQTSLTFTDSRLTANSILDFYYSDDDITYKTFTQNSSTSFTLTFDAQSSDLIVKVIVFNL